MPVNVFMASPAHRQQIVRFLAASQTPRQQVVRVMGPVLVAHPAQIRVPGEDDGATLLPFRGLLRGTLALLETLGTGFAQEHG